MKSIVNASESGAFIGRHAFCNSDSIKQEVSEERFLHCIHSTSMIDDTHDIYTTLDYTRLHARGINK
jgi:hypothetical protein